VRTLGLPLLLASGALGLWSLFESPRIQDRHPASIGHDVAEVVGFELPIEVNERVRTWIARYINQGRSGFERYLSREGLYGGLIRSKLDERGMPRDLLYLAMIESGFRPEATSPVSAAGVWQFMGPTAVEYGLEVHAYVDERRDPVRATDAALDYLEILYDRFGSWYLAAAAYNAGPNRVARILRRHADDRRGEEELYWEIIEYLPRETRSYVPKLIAATLIARHAREYGFDVVPEEPYQFEQVFVPGGTSLAEVAHTLDVPARLIRDLNPHLIRGFTPPGLSYPVRVPLGRSGQVVASLQGRGRSRLVD
jgi:membrane-bound lytic murein transglycosylase D